MISDQCQAFSLSAFGKHCICNLSAPALQCKQFPETESERKGGFFPMFCFNFDCATLKEMLCRIFGWC